MSVKRILFMTVAIVASYMVYINFPSSFDDSLEIDAEGRLPSSTNAIVVDQKLEKNACFSFKEIKWRKKSFFVEYNQDIKEFKRNLKYKKMKTTAVPSSKKYRRGLRSKEVDNLSKYNLFKVINFTKDTVVLENLIIDDFIINYKYSVEDMDNFVIKDCSSHKSSFKVGQCVRSISNNKISYYKIVNKNNREKKYIVKGIFESAIQDKILKIISSSPNYNFYYPNAFYPQKVNIIGMDNNSEKIKCPKDYAPKFKKGDCIEGLGKVTKRHVKYGWYEVAIDETEGRYLSSLKKDIYLKKDFKDILSARVDEGIKDIYFNGQSKWKKTNCK